MTEAAVPAGGWVPEQGLLLHIGPHKTGTTAIQQAFAAARPQLREQGIVYPGYTGQHRMPALAVTGTRGVVGLRPPKIEEWDRFVGDVQAARRRRVVVSAESFVEADDTVAERVVRELGGDRVRVVMTLRPLAKILPSAWQQMVRNRLRSTYDDWLDEVLNQESARRQIVNFWHRHHHEQVLDRWVSIVGPERFAVVVADDADREALPHAFETVLGLPPGLLPMAEARDNRGLTAAEIELIRQLNVVFHDRGWSSELYHQTVRLGGIRDMQTRSPEPDEPKIITPAWAVDRANDIARAASEHIRASGVLVLGDLDTLSAVRVDPAAGADTTVFDQLSAAAAEHAIEGVARQIALLRDPPPAQGYQRQVSEMSTGELAGVVVDRVKRRISAKLGFGIHRYEA
jgi:hypothetical protein